MGAGRLPGACGDCRLASAVDVGLPPFNGEIGHEEQLATMVPIGMGEQLAEGKGAESVELAEEEEEDTGTMKDEAEGAKSMAEGLGETEEVIGADEIVLRGDI